MTRAPKPWVRPLQIHQNIDTGGYFVKVEFDKIGGGIGTVSIDRSQMDDPRGAKRTLAQLGARIPPDWLEDLKSALAVESCQLVATTSVSGWHGTHTFVLKDCILGERGNLRPIAPELRATLSRGKIVAWKNGLRSACAGSSYLVFTLAAGLAGPLLRPMGYDEGVVFHLFGQSSTGKSLATIAAQSVIEKAGREHLRTFDLTPRALEEDAAACNDSMLVVDEAGRMEGSVAQRRQAFRTLAFKVAGGQGKKRSAKATADGDLRNVQYLVIGLSSGEEALEGSGNLQRKEGEQVRLIGIPVPAPHDGGIFDLEASPPDRARLAREAEETIAANHGVPIRRFVRAFLADADGPAKAKALADKFIRAVLPIQTPFGQRFAKKFAVTYAAAMLAADYGIAPWTKKHAAKAIRKIYRAAWREVRPVECEADEFLAWLNRNAGSDRRFPVIEPGDKIAPKPATRIYGIRRTLQGRMVIAVLRERFSDLVARGEADVLELLETRGILLPGREVRLYVRQLRIKGMPTAKVNVLLFDLERIIEIGGSMPTTQPES